MNSDSIQIKEQILNQVRATLENDDIQSSDNLIEAGIDSKKAMELLYQMKEAGLPVSLQVLLSVKSIDELAEKLEDIDKAKEKQKLALQETIKRIYKVIDKLSEESGNQAEVEEEKRQNYLKEVETTVITGEKAYEHVLLTGATGYLGSHIAMEILKSTSYQLYLLIRGKDECSCAEKMQKIWIQYAKEDIYIEYQDRIKIVCGDITMPKLGMDVNQYNELAGKIDCIIHSAAVVSHVEPWERYQQVNVDGTKAVLKFASYIKRKDINYISTIATEFSKERLADSRLFYEEMIQNETTDVLYVRSKLECENLVDAFRKKGFGVKIFRMGFLVQNYETGQFQTNSDENAFMQVLSIMNKMKAYPMLEKKIIDMTYVNEAARAVTLLFNKIDTVGIYHIFNPDKVSISDIGRAINQINPKITVYNIEDFKKFIQKEGNHYSLELEQLAIMLMADSNVDLNGFSLSQNEKTGKLLQEAKFQWHSFDQKSIVDLYSIIKGKDE